MKKKRQDSFVDEFGDASSNPTLDDDGFYNPSRVFGYGVSIPFNSDEFANIRVRLEEFDDIKDRLGNNKRKEIKTRKLSEYRKRWLARAISSKSATYVYAVDKCSGHPDGWDEYTPSERMVAMALYAMHDIIDRTDAQTVNFIFDRHSALETPWAATFINFDLSRIMEQTGRTITFSTRSSSNSEYARHLQVTDGVSNFALESLERMNPMNLRTVKADVHILDSDDSIWQDGLTSYSRESIKSVKSKNRRGGDLPPCHGIMIIAEVI